MNKPPKGATQIDDISELKLTWVKTQDQLNQAEAENIFSARKKHLKRRRKFFQTCLNETYFRQVHYDMFCDVWDWAGIWRKRHVNIGIDPHQILFQLRQLIEDICYWNENSTELSYFEQAVILHHRLVAIHPFANGNGRHARLVSEIYLLNQGVELPTWPDDLHQVKSLHREQYLKVLKEADQGDYKPLLKFMKNLGK